MVSDTTGVIDLIFDRATILSFDDTVAFVSAMPFATANSERRENAIHMLGASASYGKDTRADSFIVARGIGDSSEMIDRTGTERAYEVIAVLSIALLFRSDFHETCNLFEQITSIESTTLWRVNSEHGEVDHKFGFLSRASMIMIAQPPIQMTGQELTAMLQSDPTGELCSALLFGTSPIHRSFREPLSRSVRFLYEMMHTTIPESQILGALTSIEILLSHHDSKAEDIRRRLKQLLGDRAYEFYRADEVFNARNSMVHRGERCTDLQAYVALVLAISTVLTYTKAANAFVAHSHLIRFLDFEKTVNQFHHEYPDAQITWEAPQFVQSLPDLYPFRLVQWGYSFARIQKMSSDQQQERFASLVLALASKRNYSQHQAFNVIITALTNTRCPFSSWDELADYIVTNHDAIELESIRLSSLLDKYSWRLD